MQAFWKKNPLTPDEVELINALATAHYQSAFRQNPSSLAIVIAAQGSGDFMRSLAAGLCAFGKTHGPIEDTYDWLNQPGTPDKNVAAFMRRNKDGKIPGWGSSFSKGQIDPIWVAVDTMIRSKWSTMGGLLTAYTELLQTLDIPVYPNPSAYTAATAIILEMPRGIAPYLLVMGRLPAWAELFLNETRKGH